MVRIEAGAAKQVAELTASVWHSIRSGTRVAYVRPKPSSDWSATVKILQAASTPAERAGSQLILDALTTRGDLVVRDLATGTERVVSTGALLKSNPAFTSDGSSVHFIGADEQDLSRSDVYLASESGAPVRLTDQAGHKANVVVGASGTGLTYSVAQTTPFRLLGGGQAAGPGPAAAGAGRGGGRGAGGGAGQGRTGGAPPGGAAPAAAAAAGVPAGPNPCGGGGRGGGAAPTFGVVDLAAKTTRT